MVLPQRNTAGRHSAHVVSTTSLVWVKTVTQHLYFILFYLFFIFIYLPKAVNFMLWLINVNFQLVKLFACKTQLEFVYVNFQQHDKKKWENSQQHSRVHHKIRNWCRCKNQTQFSSTCMTKQEMTSLYFPSNWRQVSWWSILIIAIIIIIAILIETVGMQRIKVNSYFK